MLGGCSTTLGTLPRIDAPDPSQGFKMLKPGATATACSGGVVTSKGQRLMDLAVQRLLAQDEEANAIVDAEVESTSWSIGVYGRRCVTLRGDLVRTTSTVLLPMADGHRHPSGE
jgi:hypothetical protein